MGLLSNKRLEVERVNGKTQVHVVEEFTALGTLAALGVWALVWYHGSTIFEAIAAAGTAALVSILVLVILRCALRLMSEGMGQLDQCKRPDGGKLFPKAERIGYGPLFGKRHPVLLYLISFVLCFIGLFLSFR